jgi:hypothetical protein
MGLRKSNGRPENNDAPARSRASACRIEPPGRPRRRCQPIIIGDEPFRLPVPSVVHVPSRLRCVGNTIYNLCRMAVRGAIAYDALGNSTTTMDSPSY